MPSRFLEEVPAQLVEDLGSPPARPQFSGSDYGYRNAYATPYPKANRFGRPQTEEGDRHYSYEDEDQSGETVDVPRRNPHTAAAAPQQNRQEQASPSTTSPASSPRADRRSPGQNSKSEAPAGKTGLKQGTRVRHPKYGEGTVFRREGDGDDAKITVQFQQHGVKKLVEKFAQLGTPVNVLKNRTYQKELTRSMANTKSITDKTERKKVKRAARKKAAPKATRTHARGENKAKVKKASRGQSKR